MRRCLSERGDKLYVGGDEDLIVRQRLIRWASAVTGLVSWISYRSPFIICQVLVGTGKIYQRERAVAANGTHAQRERIDTGARTVIAMDNKKRVVGEVHAGGYGAPNAGKIATTVRISIGIQNEGYAKSAAGGAAGRRLWQNNDRSCAGQG